MSAATAIFGEIAARLDAIGVSEEAADLAAGKLERYLALLTKWNKIFNLTAITDPGRMVTLHVLDSLSVLAPIDALMATKRKPRLLDVGTGAGLPGIPLAIVRPEWSVTLLDSNSKKTAFVTQAVAELALANACVATARAENYISDPFDIIVSRAYSSLLAFTAQTRSLLAPGGYWAAMKGSMPSAELDALGSDVEFVEALPLAVPGLDVDRHLVILQAKR